jgi:RNA polymerase-binding transcription factor DksA
LASNFDLQRAEQQRRAEENMSVLHTDEYRVCVRCGWQIKKSDAIRQGVKRCLRCGCDQCTGQSLPFDFREEH